MVSLAISITPTKEKVLLELDAVKFERLAASFGFFNSEFVDSIAKAEKDFRSGRTKKIKSLKDLK